MHRHSLQHHGGGVFCIKSLGNLNQTVGRYGGVLGVGALRAGIGHAVAYADVRHVRADGRDYTRAFLPVSEGQLGRIQTAAKVDVDEVDPRRVDLNDRLIRLRARLGNVHVLQDFGATMFEDTNSFHTRRYSIRPCRFLR